MSIDPRNHNWEKQLEKGLPDCRVKPFEREKAAVQIGRMQWDTVFCAQCFKPSGAVPPNVPHVFFICDECVYTNGPPPECVQVT
jgi:hypothetical protein